MARSSKSSAEQVGLVHGFRSGLEKSVWKQLEEAGLEVKYEEETIPYEVPASKHKYTPDFILHNGIIVETKGRFLPDDRKKHLLVKAQHPTLDIRFVFSRSSTPIYKGSKTTYAMWCEKYGFQYADKRIPEAWLTEKKRHAHSKAKPRRR